MSSRVFVLLLLCGCGGGAPSGLAFPDAPFTTLTTASGLAVEMWTSPQPPARGQLAVKFAFAGHEGRSLNVTVTPFMPRMGHGSAAVPTDAELVAEGLNIYMAGDWELHSSVSGDVTDEFLVEFNVP